MEQVFSIKIKDTEAAGIEIVPTDDGVEIIVKKRSGATAVKSAAPNNDKLEEFREFCGELKRKYKGDKTLAADLKKFWAWYSPKMSEWKGELNGDKLWTRWCSTRQGSSVRYDKGDRD